MNKKIKIITFAAFLIEFLIAVAFSILLFKLYYIKKYLGFFDKATLIYTGIIGIFLLTIIIYMLIKNKNKIEIIAISIIIPIGMLYWILMMPSQVPDELAHLWRAYELTDGKFISDLNEPTQVPADLVNDIKPYVEKYDQMIESINKKTDYSNYVEVNNTAKTYPAFLYIFPAIGFGIGRIFNINIIISAYIAKLLNYIVFLVAAYFSIKMIPFGKLAVVAILFMPMMLHQATSTSADAMVNIIVLFYIAYSTMLLLKKDKINKFEEVILVILSIIISVAKYVYLPIILIPGMLLFSKKLSKKNKAILIPSIFGLSIIFFIACYLFSGKYENAYESYFSENNINSGEQIINIIKQPIKYLKTINHTTSEKGEELLYEAVGYRLGWLEITVKQKVITSYIIMLILSSLFEKNEISFSRKQKIVIWIAIISIILLIYTGLYITWTTVGLDIINGMQGRYFIPVVLLILLSISMKNNYIKIKNINYIFPIVLTLLNIPAIQVIIEHFG